MSKHILYTIIIRTKRTVECEDCGDILPKGSYMFFIGRENFCPKCGPKYCDPPESTGQRVRALRKANKYTIPTLAEMCQMNKSMLAHYEHDRYRPGADKLVSLAVQLNTTTDYILGLSNDPNWR